MSMRERMLQAMSTAKMTAGAVGGVMNEECAICLIDAAVEALLHPDSIRTLSSSLHAEDIRQSPHILKRPRKNTPSRYTEAAIAMIRAIKDGK